LVVGPLGPGLYERKVVMVRKSYSAGIVFGTCVGAGLAVLLAGCSVPVLRTPTFVSAPTYDSPQCEASLRRAGRHLVVAGVVLQASREVTRRAAKREWIVEP
jgi:hypothetical protein